MNRLCPDCLATSRVVEVFPNITILQIQHDDTCPWLDERNK